MNTSWTFGHPCPSGMWTLGRSQLKSTNRQGKELSLCDHGPQHRVDARTRLLLCCFFFPFSITCFAFCWHTRILLPKETKLNCFSDKSVICLPQNGKFNDTNDGTNGCGSWFCFHHDMAQDETMLLGSCCVLGRGSQPSHSRGHPELLPSLNKSLQAWKS